MRPQDATKPQLRSRLLSTRAARPAAELEQAGRPLARHALPVLAGAGTLAAYAAGPGEPPTGPLLDALVEAGVSVLLPVLLDDGDLDWARLEPGRPLVEGLRGTRHPAGPRLGVDAAARVEAVVVPGLAGTPSGQRLGRGGGSYDRALARVPPGRAVVLLVFDDEVLPELPVEPHDRPVTHVVTPSGSRAVPGWTLPTR